MSNNTSKLVDKIKECMFRHQELGGRYVLEIDLEDAEEIMYLATGQYHNSKCPECGKPVSCVCTETYFGCNHVWHCQDHVGEGKHEHRKTISHKEPTEFEHLTKNENE